VQLLQTGLQSPNRTLEDNLSRFLLVDALPVNQLCQHTEDNTTSQQ